MRSGLFSMIILFTLNTVFAQTGGKIGMAYLKIGVDARAAAMGEAYTAIARDAAASYWNPAGLALSEKNSALFMHNAWIQGVNHEFAAVQLFNGLHNLAVSLNMMFVSGIELRGEQASDNPIGETSAHNVNLGLSYATTLGNDWKIGGQIKYLYEKYYLESASGFAIDLGIMKQNIFSDLSWGLVVQNLGSMSKLRNESTRLPLSLRTGIGYYLPFTFFNQKPLFAADLFYVLDDITRLNLGLESQIYEHFSVRAGYIFGGESYGVTAGLGFRFASYDIAYAYIPFKYNLGDSHRFSLSVKFD